MIIRIVIPNAREHTHFGSVCEWQCLPYSDTIEVNLDDAENILVDELCKLNGWKHQEDYAIAVQEVKLFIDDLEKWLTKIMEHNHDK